MFVQVEKKRYQNNALKDHQKHGCAPVVVQEVNDASSLSDEDLLDKLAEYNEEENDYLIDFQKLKERSRANSELCSERKSKLSLTERNERNGYGKCVFPDGTIYIGDWHLGKMHGEGLLDNGNNYRYQGSFFDGYFNGYGELFESEIVKLPKQKKSKGKSKEIQKVETTIFKGNWKRGKRDGKGTQISSSKGEYTGEWANDCQHGKGKFVSKHGVITIIGTSLSITISSEIDEKESEDDRPLFVEKYIGNFVDGKFHGYGKMIYANKSEYKGNWNCGKRSGSGTLIYKYNIKKTWKGEWKDDRFIHGTITTFDDHKRPISVSTLN